VVVSKVLNFILLFFFFFFSLSPQVNGHSLIGVSREGAIEFLKQVKLGDTVSLLVSQEPEYLRKPQLRHTAL
jgi:hypothetical protein